MDNAVLIGLSRQIALHRELEVVANNVANINTTGYKADNAIFQEFLMPGASDGQFQGADQRLSYVHDRATWLDFKKGPIQLTGNPLDVAIDGDAFLNSTGRLVTNEGYEVQGDGGPIQFQNNDGKISIGEDGTIRVHEGSDNRSDAQRGKLRLVRFDQAGRLQKEGSSLFAAPNGMQPQPLQPPQKVRVVQGALEQSNVSGVIEMSRMIEITRSYTAIAGLLQQNSDMRHNAIDKLAEVPA
jgi:flagellar basal-body rod protein FlgF